MSEARTPEPRSQAVRAPTEPSRQPRPEAVPPGRTAPAPVAPGAALPTTPPSPIEPAPPGPRSDPTESAGTPPEVLVQVGRALGHARSAEQQLALALGLMTDRHSRDPELRDVGGLLASWANAHAEAVNAFEGRYRIVPSEGPERLRAALLGGTRVGGSGLLLDLQDLLTLAFHVRTSWTAVSQAAKELRDRELQALAADAGEGTDRAIAFLRTKLQFVAPHALTVPMDALQDVAASIPQRPTVGAIPDAAWGPIAGGVLVGIVGLGGLLVGQPWLLPSLGPSAALVALSPSAPESRGWNTIVGHAGGLLAGFAAVVITGAANAPAVLADRVLAPERVVAAVIAIALTIVLGILLRGSHPPAAATTLLVALGALSTVQDALNLAAGVILIALAGEGIRRLRLRGLPPVDVRAPLAVPARIRLERPPQG